jgi:LemA protein
MKRSIVFLSALVGALLIGVMWFVSINNNLVNKDEGVKSAWAQVENVYQRRADLIPNLVNTVKGYAAHEKETLETVVKARGQAVQSSGSAAAADAKGMENFQKAQDGLSSALSRLLVVVERYPDLKANENFKDLQVQLEGTENRIAVERRRFNEVAQDYNSYIRRFPSSLVANMRGFQPRPYFEAQKGADTAPKVQF